MLPSFSAPPIPHEPAVEHSIETHIARASAVLNIPFGTYMLPTIVPMRRTVPHCLYSILYYDSYLHVVPGCTTTHRSPSVMCRSVLTIGQPVQWKMDTFCMFRFSPHGHSNRFFWLMIAHTIIGKTKAWPLLSESAGRSASLLARVAATRKVKFDAERFTLECWNDL